MDRIAVDFAVPVALMSLLLLCCDQLLDFAARSERRVTAFVLRGAVAALFVTTLPVSETIIERLTAKDSINRIWVDPLPLVVGVPLLVGLPLLALLRSSYLRQHKKARVLLIAWVTIVLGLSSVNWCAPGWCAHYGFPFSFYGWSDAMISINGWAPSGPFSPLTFFVDCLVWGAVAHRIIRKGTQRLAAEGAT